MGTWNCGPISLVWCACSKTCFATRWNTGGESVTVTVGTLPNGFYVEDDGPGIPEEKRDKVLKEGIPTREEGTGLGLSIVQSIAEAHTWDLALTEGSEGGARFEFGGVGAQP